jgi:hypothetical protein
MQFPQSQSQSGIIPSFTDQVSSKETLHIQVTENGFHDVGRVQVQAARDQIHFTSKNRKCLKEYLR